MIVGEFEAILPLTSGPALSGGELVREADSAGTLDDALQAVARSESGGPSHRRNVFERHDVLEADLWLSPGMSRARHTEPDDTDVLAPLRKLTDDERLLIAGGSGSDITVVGPDGWDWNFPPSDDGGGSGGWGGQTGSGTSSEEIAPHTQDCGTEDGAAVQVAKHVTGTPVGAGPPNPLMVGGLTWQQVEFGAVIVRNADGTYGALNDAIYSNGSSMYVVTPDSYGTNAVGIWHNHVDRGDDNQDAIDSYPSASNQGYRSDWDALQELKDRVAPNDPSFDPSLWIMGPDGVTREFKLSERAFLEGLSPEQMHGRVGLAGRERTQSCN